MFEIEKTKLVKVISGGQVGTDQAALAAAHDLGIATGGWAPKGFRTLYGLKPDLSLLGLKEHKSDKYKPRTWANVKDSQGTLRLAFDFSSAGEVCTLNAIKYYRKPCYDINLREPDFCFDVVDFIKDNHIQVLNCAGNAGKTKEESTKIFKLVRRYLKSVFRGCM